MTKILARAGSASIQLTEEFPKEAAIESASHSFQATMRGLFINRISMDTDKLLPIESPVMNRVLADISKFLVPEVRERYKDFGILYRRGILLHGAPGTGKSALLNIIADSFIKEHGGYVVRDFRPTDVRAFVNHVRAVEGNDRPVMFICEEFDSRLDQDDFAYTNMLDGEYSVPNSIFLATTNFIDRIPARIKNRPSRFALVEEVGYPELAARLSFLKNLVPEKYLSMLDINALAEKSEGLSIDHLKDVVISVCCFGLDYDTAVAKVKMMQSAGDDNNDE